MERAIQWNKVFGVEVRVKLEAKMGDSGTEEQLPTIADDLVVTKYKMAAEIVNGKKRITSFHVRPHVQFFCRHATMPPQRWQVVWSEAWPIEDPTHDMIGRFKCQNLSF